MQNSRRNFIKKTSAATIGAAAIPAFSNYLQGAVAPSDQVNVALIGCRNMGFGILQHHLNMSGVNCVGLCDIDKNVLEEKAGIVARDFGQQPKLYGDFRKVLENKDIDAVIVGTPDHWHCLPTIYALQAGKDVYVEKPMANSIEECNRMVKAAKRYNKNFVQVGQQQRSGQHWNQINQLIKEGRIGKLRKTNIWGNFNYGIGQLKKPDTTVPEGVDFDMWLGPAKERSFNPTRFHGSWRMFWDYGGGLVTDWGVHLIDMAFWAKDINTPPKIVMASGGNLSFPDHNHETFDTMSVIFQFEDDYTVTWEHTAGTQNGPWDKNYGLAFVGDLGTIVADRSGFKLLPEWDNDKKAGKIEPMEKQVQGENHAEHVQNFVQCIRKREQPVCTPEIGRAVAVAAHSANIAIRSGTGLLHWDDQQGRFSNSDAANAYVVPEYRAPWKLPEV
jgi:predicted dehydrogenase